MPDNQPHSGGIFYGLGRGIFIALLVFGLPAAAVIYYYDSIQQWSESAEELPVLEEMLRDFHSGVEVLGPEFAAKLKNFYNLDSMQVNPEVETPQNLRYWKRPEVERDLFLRISKNRRGNMMAYLDYIDRYKHLAVYEMRRAKIPASITLAQGLLESDAGRGFLPRQANNHFGIKCRMEAGARRDGRINRADFNPSQLAIDCVQRKDDYEWDHFEVYENAANSFRRHSHLLLGERYNWMIRAYPIGENGIARKPIFGQTDVPYYAAWSVGLKSSGYATAPRYAEAITQIIETYQLWKIDYESITANH